MQDTSTRYSFVVIIVPSGILCLYERNVILYPDLVQANVRSYYQQYEAQLNQSLIDQKVKEHLGAFRPPVASYVRPGLPVLPTPLPGQFPSFRPPVLPRPMPGHLGMLCFFPIAELACILIINV